MRIFRAFQNPIQQPSFDQVDGGSGGGAAGAGGQQQGGGQQLGGGAGGGSGSGGAAPVAYSDDMQITRDGKTMTMKEFISSQYVPKAEHENVRNLTRQEIENNIRKIAARMQQGRQQQGQQQQGQGERVDPFAKVRGLPLVDGDTLAELASAGFGQIGNTIQQQQQAIQQLAGMIKKLQGGVGTLAKERSGQERTQRVAQAISSLGEGYDVKDPLLNDVAQDLIDAWEFQNEGEFHKMFSDRVSQFEKFIRARDKAKLETAKKTRFLRPGGNGTPGGAARPDPRVAASQAADILFGPRQGART